MQRVVRHGGHLAWRFFTSVLPVPPSVRNEVWARHHLLPGERVIWEAMSAADRRHSVAVARRTIGLLGEQTPRSVVAAALLHDSGKTFSGLGTFARVAATLLAGWKGEEVVVGWQGSGGWRGRFGAYVNHAQLGAARLASVGSDPVTVAWTADHHRSPAEWEVPQDIGAALKRADGD